MADETNKKSSVAELEEKILEFWNKNNIFEKSLAKPSPKGEFVFYDGPPFATGLPHYGHIVPGTIKDVIPRYKTMQGYHVPRKWGWDCHGLPLENLVEAELNLRTKKDIEEYGIDRFNKRAHDSVLRYADDWKKSVPRLGRWVDMENDYKTMDTSYTESVWWVFKTLYDKGLIYEGFKSMHLCPRCETTLSNFEVAQGYKDIVDFAVTVKLKLEEGSYLLVWTTTPWTLPGNMAAAVNKDEEYVEVEYEGERIILAKKRLDILEGPHKVISTFPGSKLVGKNYTPPFDYYTDSDISGKSHAWKIYHAPYVSMEDGTGAVHLAPAFGAEDMELAQEKGIPIVHHVKRDGTFAPEVKDFSGLPVKPKDGSTSSPHGHQTVDIEIIKHLAHNGLLFKKEKITHSYPLCWRCDTPLLNYASHSWFVKVTQVRDTILRENKKTTWIPPEFRDGRFGKGIEQAPDWAISRSRYWGAPLPVWRNEETGETVVVGSTQELKAHSASTIAEQADLHRPNIDSIVLRGKDGSKLKRVSEVFDCWFESGSMPYGSNHYPFEHLDKFNPKGGFFKKPKGFPADFIAESIDQTRGWFYSMLVLSVSLFGRAPYKAVITNGMVLAEDGRKMSKRLKNYPEPMDVVNRYGADALRYYLLSSPVIKGEDLNFSEKGVDEVMKKVIVRLGNVLAFHMLYRNKNTTAHTSSEHVLDRWIIARAESVVRDVTSTLEQYELDRATRPLGVFVDDLSTWYVRRSRDRFKGTEADDALATLEYVLLSFSKVMAPFMPFFAEHLYQTLKKDTDSESVHLTSWPSFSKATDAGAKLISDMDEVRNIVSQGLQARARAGIKVRQPLALLTVKSRNKALEENKELLSLIQDEVNVKKVSFDPSISEEVVLDTTLTQELRDEGAVRELIRHIQDMRKKQEFSPHDQVALTIQADPETQELIDKWKGAIKHTASLSSITFSSVDGEPVSLSESSSVVLGIKS
jgi:isoleucyl-tRNA synthetase|tara:strand:- start:37561 stop:40482 length:2922 start_codon:yes stop_codon:yes gene_type:complete